MRSWEFARSANRSVGRADGFDIGENTDDFVMAEYVSGPNEGVLVKDRVEVKPPPLYRVFLHNDDYTTMEFVVYILQTVFRKKPDDAYRVMMHVHRNGVGMAGVYTAEIAETKVDIVHVLARENGYPLRCTMEPE
jgi:ATP-dependent Clp protease adaptor protein ClpS